MTTKIIGTGSYVPAQIVTNDDLSKIVETNDQWIRSRTGIGERRIATDDSTSDMAAKAAARAIEQAGIDPVYFGVIFIINNAIGLITPPVGTTLNVICGVAKAKMDEVMVGVMPFMIAELIVQIGRAHV